MTETDALAIATRLRESIVSGETAVNGDCTEQARLAVLWHADAEIWGGNYEQNPDQYHLIVKVGEWYIDATGDQFPGGWDITAFREEDMEPGCSAHEYGGFVRRQTIETAHRKAVTA